MSTPFDSRQTIYRGQLQQLLPNLSNQELDNLLRSINADLQAPCRMDAASSPSLVVTVQSSLVSNSESNRQKSMSHVGDVVPNFTSGTITFPASSGGNIVASPGNTVALTCTTGNFVKVLVSMDASSNLVITPGSQAASESAAVVPAPVVDTNPIGYIIVSNVGGTIQNIAQNKIIQFAGSGGGAGGGGSEGVAQSEALSNGATSHTVAFPVALPNNDYIPQVQIVNLTDSSPMFIEATVTAKTSAGFTLKWNSPLDSANYLVSYLVPNVQMQVGGQALNSGVDSATVTLPIALSGSVYVVIAQLANYTDGSPQFQPVTVTARTSTTFTAKWNGVTDSANYVLSYHVAEYT